MARKRLITVEEAILVHLLGYRRYFGEGTVPIEMSQAGISQAIGIRRSHVSSSLDTAKEKGNVDEGLAHVRGEARRRKCYSLTEKGMALAKEVEERVERAVVSAALLNGEVFEGSLGELAASDIARPLVWMALKTVDGVLALPTTEPEGKGISLSKVPVVMPFLGRMEEQKAIKEFFEREGKVLVIKGMPGIGKTALAAEVSGSVGASIFWFSIGDWSSPRNTASHLGAHLQSLGSDRLKRYVDARERPDLADLRDILMELDVRLTIILDDCQNASASMGSLLRTLISVCEANEHLDLILVGRGFPGIFDLKHRTGHVCLNLELEGLDTDASFQMLKNRGIVGHKAETMVKRSGGHPLFLTLIASDEDGEDAEEMSTLISREIQDSLTAREREMLYALSVFREPVATDAIAKDEEGVNVLEGLKDRSIVTHDGRWQMHSLLKDFFYGHQGRVDREMRHEMAAEYYGAYASTSRESIEEAYHLFMARDAESAMLRIATEGDGWLRKGYQDEFLQLCTLIPEGWESPVELFEVLMLKAMVLKQVGEWDSAERVLERCLDICGGPNDAARRARTLLVTGAIHYRRGELSGALELFEEAKGLIRDDDELMAELQNSIGVVNWRLGRLDAARTAYYIDLKISDEKGDLAGIARSLNNLGILDWQEGRSDAALERYARALEAAQRVPDKRLVAMLYSNIADAYKSKGESSEAKRFYERCLELSEDLRFNWQIAEAFRGLADIVEDRRDEYLKKALRMFERLGAKEDAKAVKVMMR